MLRFKRGGSHPREHFAGSVRLAQGGLDKNWAVAARLLGGNRPTCLTWAHVLS